MRKIRNFE